MKIVSRILFVCLSGLIVVTANAQDFPNKPVRIIVGSTAGGVIDIPSRIVGEALSKKWGQPVVVENRLGASEMIGAAAVLNAPADGYTIFAASSVPYTVNQFVFNKLNYDPEKSFTHIALLARNPMAVVASSKAPFDSFPSMVAYGRANPGQMTWSSPGNGGLNMVVGEWIAGEAKFKALPIAYKGGPPAMQAVVSNEVMYSVSSIGSALQFAKANQVKILGVTTATRTALAPQVPTMIELGIPEVDAAVTAMFSVPSATPPAVVNKLIADVASVMQIQSVRDQILGAGIEPLQSTPADVDSHVKTLRAKVQKVVAANSIKAE